MGSYTTIVVGTDGSDTSLRAVDRAAAIARDAQATLLLVSAYEPQSKEQIDEARHVLRSETWEVVGSAPAESNLSIARDRAVKQGATSIETLAVQGQPVSVIRDVAESRKADLIVVGNVGLNTLHGRILGSVPSEVARRSGVDVLIVHTV